MTTDKQQIKDRAHAIWESEGRPHGRAEDHWHQAERELGTSAGAANGATPAPLKSSKAATPKAAKTKSVTSKAATSKAAVPKTVQRTKKAPA